MRDPSAGASGTTARRGAATSVSLTGATPSIPAVPDAAPNAGCIEPALGTLTASQRQALELSYFAGCTTRQVAGVSEESVEAATAGIRDGLIRLRDTLAPVPGHRAHSAG